jgi:hypothetical protein
LVDGTAAVPARCRLLPRKHAVPVAADQLGMLCVGMVRGADGAARCVVITTT